ncbi:MAG: hypothetical protein HKN21_17750 [Candidatus Eisenbacteria bacterium]|uniref:DUF2541 family protein n=1 Tax=Eiseniibacteriota bacterium TaxID=2212470 RepID=A0A7Y2EB69_UNCEI|nr:hypothetical protein [Candidatus Eisenbacteria bacterium]
MRFSKFGIAVCFALSVLLPACAGSGSGSSAARWDALGSRVVHGKQDRDVIGVPRNQGPYRKLKVEVKGSALHMHNIVVHFANGQKYSPDSRLIFKKGSRSRTIDLPGDSRFINEITFRYSNLPGGGRATVKVFGR